MRNRMFLAIALLLVLPGLAGCVISPPSSEASSPTREGYITVGDGLRLYYRAVGGGPETVIIPAAAWMAEDMARLAEGRTLIFYDPRNRGRSDAVEDPSQIGIDYDVADLEAIRQHSGKEQVSLIGWSYLGGVVARYAMEYPERVSRLVQVSPMRPYHATRTLRRLNYSTHVSSVVKRLDEIGVDKSDLAAYECRLWFEVKVAPYILVDPASIDLVTWPCDLPNERPEHFYEWPDYFDKQVEDLLGSTGGWDWRAEAASLRVPTLVIRGEMDTVPLEGSRTWASRSNARLLVIEGTGHASWVEKPGAFFPAVDRFLRGEWPEDAQWR